MSIEEIFSSNYNAPPPQPQQGNNYNNIDNNNNTSRGIINPFTAENKGNDLGNHNNNKNMGYMPNNCWNNFCNISTYNRNNMNNLAKKTNQCNSY